MNALSSRDRQNVRLPGSMCAPEYLLKPMMSVMLQKPAAARFQSARR
jgi:hypothetical protein